MEDEIKLRKQAVEWIRESHPENSAYALKLSGIMQC